MGRQRTVKAALALVAAALLTVSACATASVDTSPASPSEPTSINSARPTDVTLPPTTGGFDYQLGGPYPPPAGVSVVERDSTTAPAAGVYSICYVNGFQTQPGVTWPDELILHRPDGSPLVDPGWPDEHILDISTTAKRTAAAERQQSSITQCADKGFRAVEFDNLDSYSRSKGALSVDDAVAFARILTDRAHRASLAVAQKNTADRTSRARDEIGFDFAVTEECDRFDECGRFTDVYGPHVYDIEYTDDLRGTFAAVCARPHTPPMTILRDHDLTASGGSVRLRVDPTVASVSCRSG